jgi:hypothetical protein
LLFIILLFLLVQSLLLLLLLATHSVHHLYFLCLYYLSGYIVQTSGRPGLPPRVFVEVTRPLPRTTPPPPCNAPHA